MDLSSTMVLGVVVVIAIGAALFFLVVRDKVTKSVVALKKDDKLHRKSAEKIVKKNSGKQTESKQPAINNKTKEKIQKSFDFKESPDCISKFSAHTDKCLGVSWLNSHFIVSVGKDRSMMLHDVATLTGRDKKHFKVNLDCGVDVPNKVTGSIDGKFVVVGFKSNKTIAYQIFNKKVDGKFFKKLHEYPSTSSEIASIKVSKHMILTCLTDTTLILSSFKGEEIGVIKPKLLRLHMADIDLSETVIAVASAMNDIRLYHTSSVPSKNSDGEIISHKKGLDNAPFAQLRGHTASVSCVCFLPNSKTLASSSHDGTWKLWNLEGDAKRNFEPHVIFSGNSPNKELKYEKMLISPDGHYILIQCGQSVLQVWTIDGANSSYLTSFLGDSEILDFSWSPTTSELCVAYSEGLVRLFQIPVKK